jgi:hypothetical protein
MGSSGVCGVKDGLLQTISVNILELRLFVSEKGLLNGNGKSRKALLH